MATSQVDICNSALQKQAQDITIASITESSKPARVFNRAWDRVRDYVLAEHSWPFALKAAPLAEVLQAPFPGWAKRYAYPDDCITALAVCDAAGVRAGVCAYSACYYGEPPRAFAGRVPFEVTHGEQSTSITTDLAGAYLIYTCRVVEVARYPAMFEDALACRLAYETAPSIMGELGFRAQSNLLQAYEFARAKAAAHGLNEAQEDPAAMTPAQAARGGY